MRLKNHFLFPLERQNLMDLCSVNKVIEIFILNFLNISLIKHFCHLGKMPVDYNTVGLYVAMICIALCLVALLSITIIAFNAITFRRGEVVTLRNIIFISIAMAGVDYSFKMIQRVFDNQLLLYID